MTRQDQQQRLAEVQWAIGQCLIYGLPTEAVAILAHECGFNKTDLRMITEAFAEEA
jgi:hypothetical protein